MAAAVLMIGLHCWRCAASWLWPHDGGPHGGEGGHDGRGQGDVIFLVLEFQREWYARIPLAFRDTGDFNLETNI